MNFADAIKQAVTMRQVAEYYGLQVDRAGFACCPFHREKTASFKVYDGSGGYHCFGCGETGDVIDFVRKMDEATFPEACQRLNDIFALGLPIGKKLTRREAEDAGRRAFLRRRERKAAQMAAEGAERAYWEAFDAWLNNLSIIEQKAPKTENEPWSDEFCEAAGNAAWLEYQLDQAEIARYEQQKAVGKRNPG